MRERNVIAVIDDSAIMREAMNALLSSYGFRVELYESAEQFIPSADRTRASCLIADLHLEGMTGIAMVRELKKRGYQFPTILMTGDPDSAVRDAAEQLGCFAFLQKPFGPGLLIETVVDAIESTSPPLTDEVSSSKH